MFFWYWLTWVILDNGLLNGLLLSVCVQYDVHVCSVGEVSQEIYDRRGSNCTFVGLLRTHDLVLLT